MGMLFKDGPFGIVNINVDLLCHRCIVFNVVKRYFQKEKNSIIKILKSILNY